ncbi:MAG: coproporphyrinogen III oxidase [Anaerolinea sp.]|nr:coproporphyrinogen III oxidase [Anaerolinea sp.]
MGRGRHYNPQDGGVPFRPAEAVIPLSVYVHIPFCTVKCSYCDFNAYAGMDNLKESYAAALVSEVQAWRHVLAGAAIATIGFGGGTPGEVPATHIAAVIDAIRAEATLAAGAEISLEANPGSITGGYLGELAHAGVNRISFGAQSFDPAELSFLDRIHSPEAIGAAMKLAREAGIASVGLDLMYGLPDQKMSTWRDSVSSAVALGVDHISLYALTIEDGTPLAGRVEREEVVPLDPDSVATMYEAASEWLAAAGYLQYELSNWARPGHESRHNQVYWTGGDYLGIGAGAHGFIAGERYEDIAHPRTYIHAAKMLAPSGRRPNTVVRAYRPDEPTAMCDWVTLALRRLEGFPPGAFRARFGRELDEVFGPPLADCEAAGVLSRGEHIRLTSRGRLLHGEVAVRLLAHATATR